LKGAKEIWIFQGTKRIRLIASNVTDAAEMDVKSAITGDG